MPYEMKNGIKQRIYEIKGLTDNPIGRIPIHVGGMGGQLHLTEVYNEELITLNQSITSEASTVALTSSVQYCKYKREWRRSTTPCKEKYTACVRNVSQITG
jgi:hypothetical protein